MVKKKGTPSRPQARPRRAGVARGVLVNWLRHDTSIFHDSFPATEDNVKRVILELERFPGCYSQASDTFNVDQVAEWVRVNAAPFAEKMEPPPFLEAPIPESVAEPAPPGAPPEEEEIQAIHLESAVFDKVDFEAMTRPEEDGIPVADEVAPPPDAQPPNFAPGDEVVTQILPGGFTPEMDDKVTQIISPDEIPGLQEVESGPPAAPEPPPAPPPPAPPPPTEPVEDPGSRTVLLPEAVAQEILDEVNTSLDSSYGNPQEGLEALGSAYRGLKEGLTQLVGDLRSLTGREVGNVRDPGLQIEAVRGTIREVIEGFRSQARGQPSGGMLGEDDMEDILVVIPKEVVDAVKEAGVGREDRTAFLRALLERLGATARENLRHREEVDKLRSALETQFKITTQIREAWVKISKELAQKKAEAAARKA